MNASPWLQRLSGRPDAMLRLFCFHHAGGSAASFSQWPQKLPQIDVCAVQLPGRANRYAEPAMTRIPQLVEAFLPHMLPLLDRPYALFGHSMGTAVVNEVAQRLRARGAALPVRLFVSGRQPPHKPYPEFTLDGLSDAAAIESIGRIFGGLPAEVLAYPELVEMILPILRADFALLERYLPAPQAPLPVPIVALGGSDDACAAPDRLLPWQDYTTHPLRMCRLPGDHFYLDARLDDVLAVLRAECGVAEAGTPAWGVA